MDHTSTSHGDQVQILAFCCEHCAYNAADLAGGLRMQYPANVKIVRLPCTGKLDVLMALQAFENGVDGVMVAGWLHGDCHYLEGNVNAARRVKRVQELLEEIGLEPERVQMFNMSSAMAGQFVTSTEEMIAKIEKLGLNPLRKSELLESELSNEMNSLEDKSLSPKSEVSK